MSAELVAWLRKVAPAHKEGTARGFAFNMEGLCLQELNAKINEAADRLQSLLSDRDKLEQLLERVWACRVNVQGRFINIEKLWSVIDDIGVALSQREVS